MMIETVSSYQPVSDAALLSLYHCMVRIRCVEERIRDEYASRNIRCAVHLSIGQEAAAAGVLLACRPSDCCVSTHRCHAHYLAKGGCLQAMVDELYGLGTGCCRGYGGSMHLFDHRVNMWGSSAVLGGSIPIGVGLGLALKRRGTNNISVVFSGDGGIDEGGFYETMNLAAVLRLPVLFAVENNGYSTLTRQEVRQANPDIVAKARAFGLQAVTIDGNDAPAVYATAQQVIADVRAESRPALIELQTYRLCAHVGPAPDVGPGKRPPEEFEAALEREPIGRLREESLEQRPELLPSLIVLEAEVESEVDAAFETAKQRFAEQAAERSLPPPPPPPRYSAV
jgi:TPP-dependent pyruvate/acetoin dehydrogenase alpha subunit